MLDRWSVPLQSQSIFNLLSFRSLGLPDAGQRTYCDLFATSSYMVFCFAYINFSHRSYKMLVWQNWEFPFSTLRKFWVVFSDFFWGGSIGSIEGELIEFFVKNSWQLGRLRGGWKTDRLQKPKWDGSWFRRGSVSGIQKITRRSWWLGRGASQPIHWIQHWIWWIQNIKYPAIHWFGSNKRCH